MHMNDWTAKLDSFLQLNDRNILEHVGKISPDMAKELAETEYEKCNRERIRYSDSKDSDFDEAFKQIENNRYQNGETIQ
ncbi:MAG: RhuM family protein [Euryarchaeota archaeon]|nr:RhuM family protein [Euryarchaeota archaeon]